MDALLQATNLAHYNAIFSHHKISVKVLRAIIDEEPGHDIYKQIISKDCHMPSGDLIMLLRTLAKYSNKQAPPREHGS